MVKKYEIKIKDKIIKCVDFDGFIDQLNYIYDFLKSDKYGTTSEVNKKDEFFGKYSLSQTIDGMNYGFQKSTDYITNIIEQTKSYKDDLNGINMDIEGFAYDMGSVVSGVPECCINMKTPTPTPVFKIVVDLCFSWDYTAENILNRGTAITSLIESLLAHGYIVDLYVMDYNIQYDMDVLYTVKIDTRNLSISNIAFMSTPDYWRKIGWITTECIRNKQSEIGRGRSELTDFVINKIKKEKIFFVGGSYTHGSYLKNLLATPQTSINYLVDSFNKYCKNNKINVSLNNIDKNK